MVLLKDLVLHTLFYAIFVGMNMNILVHVPSIILFHSILILVSTDIYNNMYRCMYVVAGVHNKLIIGTKEKIT